MFILVLEAPMGGEKNVGGWVWMIDGQDSSMPLVPLGLHLAALGPLLLFAFSVAPSLPIPKSKMAFGRRRCQC